MTTKEIQLQEEILTHAYEDYGQALKRYALSKVQSEDVCEDLVQNTFIKTWKYLVGGGKIEMMKAFLYHVLNNLVVDEYRKCKRKAISLEQMVEAGFQPFTDEAERIMEIIDSKAAALLIDRLSEKYRRIIKMRFLDNLSLEEMSRAVGQSKNAIAVQVHRGLEKLKGLYREMQFVE